MYKCVGIDALPAPKIKNILLKEGTMLKGISSSNHQLSGDVLVFQWGVNVSFQDEHAIFPSARIL